MHDDPVEEFQVWLAQATEAGLAEPTAMTLATATPAGRPSARIVLLKAIDSSGFVFSTNYRSRKASELEENPCLEDPSIEMTPMSTPALIEVLLRCLLDPHRLPGSTAATAVKALQTARAWRLPAADTESTIVALYHHVG